LDIVENNRQKFIKFKCNKRWITLAPIADLIGLAIIIEDPNKLLKDNKKGITLLLVERNYFTSSQIGKRHQPIGGAFWNGPIQVTEDITIPIEKVIGGEKEIGNGWKMLMECLAEGRGISLPSLSSGTSQYASLITTYYAHARKQFKISLTEMEGVKEKLSDMYINTFTIMAMQHTFNSALMKGEKSSVLSAILKQQSTELGRKTINNAMDIFAGKGITLGSRNPIAHLYQQVPIAITVEGSNTLTRSLIIFGQGLNKSHPFVSTLFTSLENNDKKLFYNTLYSFLFYASYHSIYSLLTSFLPVSLLSLDKQIRICNSNFITFSNFLLAFEGGNMKKKQIKSGLMADIFSSLFVCYSLEHYTQYLIATNYEKFSKELNMLKNVIIKQRLQEIKTNMNQISSNHLLLKLFFNQRYVNVKDYEKNQISQMILDKNNLKNEMLLETLFKENVFVIIIILLSNIENY